MTDNDYDITRRRDLTCNFPCVTDDVYEITQIEIFIILKKCII